MNSHLLSVTNRQGPLNTRLGGHTLAGTYAKVEGNKPKHTPFWETGEVKGEETVPRYNLKGLCDTIEEVWQSMTGEAQQIHSSYPGERSTGAGEPDSASYLVRTDLNGDRSVDSSQATEEVFRDFGWVADDQPKGAYPEIGNPPITRVVSSNEFGGMLSSSAPEPFSYPTGSLGHELHYQPLGFADVGDGAIMFKPARFSTGASVGGNRGLVTQSQRGERFAEYIQEDGAEPDLDVLAAIKAAGQKAIKGRAQKIKDRQLGAAQPNVGQQGGLTGGVHSVIYTAMNTRLTAEEYLDCFPVMDLSNGVWKQFRDESFAVPVTDMSQAGNPLYPEAKVKSQPIWDALDRITSKNELARLVINKGGWSEVGMTDIMDSLSTTLQAYKGISSGRFKMVVTDLTIEQFHDPMVNEYGIWVVPTSPVPPAEVTPPPAPEGSSEYGYKPLWQW